MVMVLVVHLALCLLRLRLRLDGLMVRCVFDVCLARKVGSKGERDGERHGEGNGNEQGWGTGVLACVEDRVWQGLLDDTLFFGSYILPTQALDLAMLCITYVQTCSVQVSDVPVL